MLADAEAGNLCRRRLYTASRLDAILRWELGVLAVLHKAFRTSVVMQGPNTYAGFATSLGKHENAVCGRAGGVETEREKERLCAGRFGLLRLARYIIAICCKAEREDRAPWRIDGPTGQS